MHDITLKEIFRFDMTGKTIDAQETLSEAIERMRASDKHCLLVHTKENPVGIISEHDIVVAFARLGSKAKTAIVKDYMTIDIVAAKETDKLDEAIRIMAAHNIRHVPVLSAENRIVDFLSIMDLVTKKMSL